MNWNNVEGVNTLKLSETYFLEALIDSFRIDRNQNSSHLNISFSEKSHCLSRRITIEKIRDLIPDFNEKAKKNQELFDLLLLDRTLGWIKYRDKNFPFRYASGGTLPILNMSGKEFYCLFYRDVFPVGWNIANGGCDSLTELLVPSITVLRELAEELIIMFPGLKKECIYRGDDGKVMSRPEFEIAREQWNGYFPRLDFKHFGQQEVNIEWIDGPDQITATLMSADGSTIIKHPTTNCFLNVTAFDFSIEIDKIAKIRVSNDALLFDGEISDNKIRCRPIGLFDVEKTDKKVKNNDTNFLPDRLYFLGTQFFGDDDELRSIIHDQNINRLVKNKIRKPKHLSDIKSLPNSLDLCPITRQMINRYINQKKENLLQKSKGPKVFLSHATEDKDFVKKLFDDLTFAGVNCYKAPESLKIGDNIIEKLFDTINESDKLLIVISNNSLKSKWVQDEINEAIRIENIHKKKSFLLPIKIDNTVFKSDKGWAKRLLSFQIEDFSNWQDEIRYKERLESLLTALNS